MPTRADMAKAIAAEGKAEGRVSGNNSWPINELQIGDVYVADGFGKIIEGTLIGSNLGNGIAAHTHTGFVFYAGIRDQEENREIPNFNGFYKGYDPSAWAQMADKPGPEVKKLDYFVGTWTVEATIAPG